jgi:excisionase family DNA binding protein
VPIRNTPPDESNPDMPVLTVRMIADRLHVHVHQVRRWIHDGELRAVNLGGNRASGYRITPRDFRAFLDKRYAADDGMF